MQLWPGGRWAVRAVLREQVMISSEREGEQSKGKGKGKGKRGCIRIGHLAAVHDVHCDVKDIPRDRDRVAGALGLLLHQLLERLRIGGDLLHRRRELGVVAEFLQAEESARGRRASE